MRQMIMCAFAAAFIARPGFAESIIFPHVKSGVSDASGIVDVSLPPYSADRTGKTDVTAVVQKAFTDNKKWTTVYFPNGTYLVSNSIRISEACVTSGTNPNCGVTAPIVQGQSRAGTVIMLAPGSFTSASSPKPVLFSGDGVAQVFYRGIHNLTVLVGTNNAGANGVRWFGNNMGLMSDVSVISEDGSANIGVDLAGGEQGPCGMRDIYIKGFGTGCHSDALNSVTVLNLTVDNSRTYGVLNEGNPLYIDNLSGSNNPVAVRNTGALTLTNARLTGGSATKPAIENSGSLFARDINAQGYQKALTTSGRAGPSGLSFAEYSGNQVSLFPSPTHSMNLPYRPMPDVSWEQDTTKWGNVWVNKGGLGTIQKSDSASLQSLIDNPNITSICLPSGKLYEINGDIYIRGNIRRIIGTGGNFNGAGRLVITSDLAQPVIKIERIISGLELVNQSNKTVIIESYCGTITSTGPGDLFLSDVVPAPVTINNASERVWAWQYNAEGGGSVESPGHVKTIVQNVKSFRIFGWKDEPLYQSLDLQKGIVEIVGYMYYASTSTAGQTMFVVGDGAQFSAAGVTQVSFNGSEFSNLVQQTRGGVTKTLTASTSGTGGDLPLYTGYDSTAVANAVAVLPHAKAAAPAGGRSIRILATRGTVTVSWESGLTPDRVEVVDVRGRMVCSQKAFHGKTGTISGLAAGAYRLVVTGKGLKSASSIIVAE